MTYNYLYIIQSNIMYHQIVHPCQPKNLPELHDYDQPSQQFLLFKHDHLDNSSFLDLPPIQQGAIFDNNEPNHETKNQSNHEEQSLGSKEGQLKVKKRQSKNKNLVKFIMKLLRDESQIVKSIFGPQLQSQFGKLNTYITELFKWQKQSPKKNNISFTHLRHILENHSQPSPSISLKIRKGLACILSKNMSKLVTKNNRCCHKLVYLNALKVYQLRCPNIITSLRLQSSL